MLKSQWDQQAVRKCVEGWIWCFIEGNIQVRKKALNRRLATCTARQLQIEAMMYQCIPIKIWKNPKILEYHAMEQQEMLVPGGDLKQQLCIMISCLVQKWTYSTLRVEKVCLLFNPPKWDKTLGPHINLHKDVWKHLYSWALELFNY